MVIGDRTIIEEWTPQQQSPNETGIQQQKQTVSNSFINDPKETINRSGRIRRFEMAKRHREELQEVMATTIVTVVVEGEVLPRIERGLPSRSKRRLQSLHYKINPNKCWRQ
ncbi:hypothetical protein SLA2020_397980 [Shorea laevis]